MDPRLPFSYQPGSGVSQKTYGWLGTTKIPVLDCVPYTATVGAIAVAAHAVANTPVTLVSSTGDGVTVGASVVNASTGVLVTGLLAIGGASGAVAFGTDGTVNIWDPTKALARVVGITAANGASGTVVFTIKGYDIYGYPQTEQITPANNTQTLGLKAWKYISSITPATSDAHNYSIDTTDTIGFPLLAAAFEYTDIFMDGSLITANTGFVAPDATSPATATTGDVRGTYALQTASNNADRLVMFVTPSVANIGTTAGLVGVTQF
jgi:hypothetical protein